MYMYNICIIGTVPATPTTPEFQWLYCYDGKVELGEQSKELMALFRSHGLLAAAVRVARRFMTMCGETIGNTCMNQ